jgi:hypothetical protein
VIEAPTKAQTLVWSPGWTWVYLGFDQSLFFHCLVDSGLILMFLLPLSTHGITSGCHWLLLLNLVNLAKPGCF